MNTPGVSVVMPVHNRAWCVAEAIESVLAVAHAPLELVVVDDGSTDGTGAILADYAARYPQRVRILTHAGRARRGIAASRNLGVRGCRHAYIAFLDSDDLYLPGRFDHAIAWLEEHPRMLACVEPYLIGELGSDGPGMFVAHLTTLAPEHGAWLGAMLFANTCWNMPCITLRRSAFDGDVFDERLRFAEETAFWMQLAARGLVGSAQSSQAVCRVRRHDDHSWDPADRVADCATYFHILVAVNRWARSRTDLVVQAPSMLEEKLRSYLVEVLSDARLPLAFRLGAWFRAIGPQPALALDRRVAANLVRAPFRRLEAP